MSQNENIDEINKKNAEIQDVKAFINKTKVQTKTLKKIMNKLNDKSKQNKLVE